MLMMALPRQLAGLWVFSLLIVFSCTQTTKAATYLRTGVVDAEAWNPDWLFKGHHRQLLGSSQCTDHRWGFLCNRAQVLVQLARGYSQEDKKMLFSRLHADGAAISGYLPQDTWLVVARPDDLRSPIYRQHALLPYLPEHKLAPEWHSVLDLVHQAYQQHIQPGHQQAAQQHVQLHKHVVDHQLMQQLQLIPAASHLHTEAYAVASHTTAATTEKILIGVHFPDLPKDELQLLGFDLAVFHPAAAAAEDWQQLVSDIVADDGRSSEHLRLCQPELLARSTWELSVAVCPQDLSEVLYWLSNQASVHWLAPRPRLYLQNMVASMIVQNNGVSQTADYKAPDAHLFWEAGLDGKGQVIGIGDSGIDMHSCFFKDPNVPFTPPPEGTDAWSSPNHRKVVYYWALADSNFKDLVGHGTHTSGTLVGLDPSDPYNKATGSAKGAKVAFCDLSRTASGDVNAPQDLNEDYYPRLYAQGARIFSDSWGSINAEYDFQSSKADAWLHANQDCLSHFAAGNYGQTDTADTTITSPATAKNVVTVGATKSLTPNYLSQTIAPVFLLSVTVTRTDKTPQNINVRVVKADFGGDGSALAGKSLTVIQAKPDHACGALEGGAAKYQNAIVLARRGTCYFSEKMAAGTAAGAAAVIVVNDRVGGYFKMDAQDGEGAEQQQMSLFAITQRMGEEIWSIFNNAQSVNATIGRYTDTWEAYEDIAAFSSFGPTKDGRIKPDIVCPGELLSASSADNDPGDVSDTCLVGRKSGTSMATPMVAGHAAIMRQYFLEGFYPTGSANSSNAHTPSGPLMKALMMGGACDMKGNTEAYLPLEDSPSVRQGFGRLCLCSSLKLAGKCNTNLQVVDRVMIKDKETHKYCLRTIGGDVRIMLVWYDPPAAVSVGAPEASTLVNDLDLTVVSAGMGGQTILGNHGQTKDNRNTAERVWLRDAPSGGLEITISASINAPDSAPQNYSLVVQGAFAGQLISPNNPDKTVQGTPGGCSAAEMQSIDHTAAQPTVPAAVSMESAVRNDTASMQQEAAVSPVSTPAPSNSPAADAETVAPAAAPAAPPESPSPSPSPGVDNSKLVNILIDTMTQASPAPAPTGRRRRLAWVHTAPSVITVTVPASVCKMLSATRMVQQPYAVSDGRVAVLVPMSVLLTAGAVIAVLAAALAAAYSYRQYKLGRTISLTSAIHADMKGKRSFVTVKQAEAMLVEHLHDALRTGSQAKGSASADAAAATAAGRSSLGGVNSHSTSSLTEVSSISISTGADVNSSNSSGESTPTSPAPSVAGAAPVAWRRDASPLRRGSSQQRHSLLPTSSSYPMAPNAARSVSFQGRLAGVMSADAAGAAVQHEGGRPDVRSSHSFSFAGEYVKSRGNMAASSWVHYMADGPAVTDATVSDALSDTALVGAASAENPGSRSPVEAPSYSPPQLGLQQQQQQHWKLEVAVDVQDDEVQRDQQQ